MTPFEKALYQEHLKMALLRKAVDVAMDALREGEISEDDALEIIDATRRKVLELFPDAERQYELIIEPRLIRAMQLNRWVWVDRVVAELEGRTKLA